MYILRILFSMLACATAISDRQTPTIRTNVNLVQLRARVTDGHGHTVSGLSKDDFELFVDGVKQEISVFQGEDAPVTAGIVIDNSASMASKREEVIAAALAFARASNPHDQMFVVHFNNRARFGLPEGTPFTSNVGELEKAISAFQLGGTTALYDAIMLARTQFKRAGYARRVLLVITDGGDNSSRASLTDVQNGLLKDGAALFAVGIFDKANPDSNPDVLRKLADSTGGEAFFPEAISDVIRICEQIAGDVRHQYALGFAGAEDGKFHEIRLTARNPRYTRLDVHTRTGYFAIQP